MTTNFRIGYFFETEIGAFELDQVFSFGFAVTHHNSSLQNMMLAAECCYRCPYGNSSNDIVVESIGWTSRWVILETSNLAAIEISVVNLGRNERLTK